MPNETYNEKRLYSSTPYLKVFDKPFRIKLNNLLPKLKVFVLQRKKEWGDPLPFDLTGFTIQFRLLDANNNLVSAGIAVVSDALTGEIEYSWKNFDIQKAGVFQAEFVFTSGSSSFTLPDANDQVQIVSFI